MDEYMGTIIAWAPNFEPQGWMFCDGRILQITQYTALYSLLGVTYGGNGTTTFALPDLRGRVPVGWGNGPGLTPWGLGQKAGTETVVLGYDDMPVHAHALQASSTTSDTGVPSANRRLGVAQTPNREPINLYTTSAANTDMQPTANAGGSHGHANMQPFTVLNYIICVEGLYPPRT